jgi:hypothetical protein
MMLERTQRRRETGMSTLELTKEETEWMSGALISAMSTLADRIETAPSFMVERIEQTITEYENLLAKVEAL